MNLVILTGAGISAESGLKTFRDNDGLWENHRLEDVATPEAFARDPELVHRFYNARRQQLDDPAVRPNAAHDALGRLESEWNGEFLLVTQNVDNLHERGGSRAPLHMHGELAKIRCVRSGQSRDFRGELSTRSLCDCCSPPAALRPHIVWFGEMPFEMEWIVSALGRADLFISIGTSGNVYPAAGFVEIARNVGARTVELNLEPSSGSTLFDEVIHGPAGTIVPDFVERLLTTC